MARYLSLIRFTEQGIRDIKKSASRASAFQSAAKKAGVTVEAQFWTAGSFDGVMILNGEEKEILRSLAQLVAQGNVKTESLRALDTAEFSAIVG